MFVVAFISLPTQLWLEVKLRQAMTTMPAHLEPRIPGGPTVAQRGLRLGARLTTEHRCR
jgi:hypothetical protein